MPSLTTDHAPAADAFRAVADFIAALPAEVPDPVVSTEKIAFDIWTPVYDDTYAVVRTVAQQVRHIARTLGGRWEKNDPAAGSYNASYYRLTSGIEVGGRQIEIVCVRTEVCEKVQIGTETVTVPAAPAVEEHEEERPVFTYECRPLNDAAGRELDDILAEFPAAEVTA